MKNKRKNNMKEFEERIGVVFKNKRLLSTALTHRSYVNEHRNVKKHNERLEFLGDAVLELITSEYLFKRYSNRPEGDLTSFRAALVRTDSLAETSHKLGVGNYLKLSKGEEETGGREKDFLLANTFEAIVGAIYLDQGYETSKKFVNRFLIKKIDDIVKNRSDIDGKTRIQEFAQSRYKEIPVYEVADSRGPDHDKEFTVIVKIKNKVVGKGVGGSKQKAEEDAATNALKNLENTKI